MSNRRDVALDGQNVRFYLDGNENGDNWVQARIEDGQLRVVASDSLVILPHSSNVVFVRNN